MARRCRMSGELVATLASEPYRTEYVPTLVTPACT